ncbi:MAG: hypothetical protein ACXVA9_03135 [Bdellovibrionales bacterium]
MKFICLILSLSCSTALASATKSNVVYAKAIAKAFARFTKPADALELLKHYSSEEDRKYLQEYVSKNPLTALPKVEVHGEDIRLNFTGDVQTLHVVNGAKGLFSIKGVEVNLSPDRSLVARLKQLEEILARKPQSAFWQYILPEAEALMLGHPVAVAAVGAVASSEDEYQNALDTHFAVIKVESVCSELLEKPTLLQPNAFSDELHKQLSREMYEPAFKKKRPIRDVENWRTTTRAYLEVAKPTYCNWGKDHWIKDALGTDSSEAHAEACKDIQRTIQCLKNLEDKPEAKLFKEQHAELGKWLTEIAPGNGKSATQLATELGISSGAPNPGGASR